MKKTGFAAACLLMIGFAGCYNDKANELYPGPATCDTANVTYSGTIKPLATQHCAFSGCHIGGAPAGGYDLSVHAGFQAALSNNRLLGAIRHEQGFSHMPKFTDKLDDCTLAKFEKWVAAGAPNN